MGSEAGVDVFPQFDTGPTGSFLNRVHHARVLAEQMAAGLDRNRSELVQKGIISDVSLGTLKSQMRSLMDRWLKFLRRESEDGHIHDPTAELNKLLVASGMAIPILLDDWDVGRTKKAADTLGIKSFLSVEDLLSLKYGKSRILEGPMIHFHKGPGNGYLMEELREKRRTVQKEGVISWEEVGMGDRLYFLIADLLKKFVSPELRKDKVIDKFIPLIANALRRKLKDEWYEQSGNLWYEFKPKVGFFDMNTIFRLLSSPELLLENWYDAEEKTVRTSGEFDEDTNTKLGSQVAELLDSFGTRSGRSFEIDVKRIALLQAEIADLEKRESSIRSILGERVGDEYHRIAIGSGRKPSRDMVQKLRKAAGNPNLFSDALPGVTPEEHVGALRRSINASMPGVESRLVASIEEKRTKVASLRKHWSKTAWELRAFQHRFQSLPITELPKFLPKFHKELCQIVGIDLPRIKDVSGLQKTLEALLSNEISKERATPLPGKDSLQEVVGFLSTIFTDEFVSEVSRQAGHPVTSGVDKAPLDLNEHIPVAPTGFIPGFFVDPSGRRPDIPSSVPKGSVHLMTATRSDSHEGEEDFEADIIADLDTLAPGGVLHTDGMRASYSRIYRFHEITRAISKATGKFRSWCVLNRHNHAVRSVIIQKEHPEGFLTDNEIRDEVLNKDSYVVPLEQVVQRVDIEALNAARRRIQALSGRNPVVFRGLQAVIHKELDRILFRLGVERTAEINHIPLQPGMKGVLSSVPQVYGDTVYDETTQEVVSVPGSVPRWKDFRRLVLDTNRSVPDRFGSLGSKGRGEYARKASELLAARINEAVQRTGLVSGDILPTLHVIHPNAVNLFPSKIIVQKRAADTTDFNAPNFMPGSKLADNDTGEHASERLDGKIATLNNRLSGLHRHIGPPIVLITFRDCATNHILQETLKRLLGTYNYKSYVAHLNITFTSATTPSSAIRNAQQALAKYLDRGAVIVGGGSWVNTDDPWGEEYRETIGTQLLNAAADPKSGIFQIPICFSSQIAAQLVGEKYLQGDLSVRHGPLEMAPVTVRRINDADVSHPLLKDLPVRFTLAATHGSHILWSRSRDKSALLPYWRPLLRSELTGQDVAWDAFDGRMFPFLLHPEVPVIDEDGSPSSAVGRIMTELNQSDIRRAIYDTWGICKDDLGLIWQNWNQVRDGHVRANIGDELFINALLEMARRLKEHLDQVQPPRRRK